MQRLRSTHRALKPRADPAASSCFWDVVSDGGTCAVDMPRPPMLSDMPLPPMFIRSLPSISLPNTSGAWGGSSDNEGRAYIMTVQTAIPWLHACPAHPKTACHCCSCFIFPNVKTTPPMSGPAVKQGLWRCYNAETYTIRCTIITKNCTQCAQYLNIAHVVYVVQKS